MTNYVWYPVTGDGQTQATGYVWNGGVFNWNTGAFWAEATSLLLPNPNPVTGAVPGSGGGSGADQSQGPGLDNVGLVAGDISPSYFGLYTPNPQKGDPYINSNSYPVDLLINSGTVDINNLLLATFNPYADVPQYPTIDVEGATLKIEGTIVNTYTAVFPEIVVDVFGFPVTIGGTVTASGGGIIDIGGGGTVEASGSVQSSIVIDFTDATQNLLILGGVSSSQPGEFAGTIEGFGTGDTIDLPSLPYSAADTETFTNNILTISNGTTTLATLQMTGSYTTSSFALVDDNSGTAVVVAGGTVSNTNWLPVVDLAIQGVLRQAPDPTTTATIAGELTAGTITEGGMISGLISEAQSTTVPGLVTFNQFYGTTPSSAGLDYLANFDVQLAQAGFSLINVWVNLGASFAANGQFGAEYGSMTPVQFVDAAYTSIFGYAPSQAAQNVFTSSVDFYTTFAGSELGAYGAEAGIMMYLANQDPTSTYAIAATNFLEAAALGTATYQTSLVGTYAAPVSAASSLQTSSGITTFAVLDSSANVAASLNSLEGDSKLIAITLTDTGPLSISAVQLSSDAAALAEINSSFSLSVTGTSGADTADLSKISASATINLAGDTVSASAGLNAPSLTFVGPVDTILLGSAAATVDYAVQPASGIEEIFNFQYGSDQLDLLGVAPGQLEAFDTTVNGQHAIALASSSDLTHGVVLAGMGSSQTAADLLANHLTFSNGNAIVT